MGYALRRMIRDGAPPEWSPLMRLVASEIADDARDPEDDDPPLPAGTWPWSAIPVERDFRKGKWVDGLAERTSMSPRAISRTLADLAEAGYEMRKPITDRNGRPVTDKRGRLVFAAKGHALRFQVPQVLPREVPQSSPDSATIQQSLPEVAGFEGQRFATFGVKGRRIWRPRLLSVTSAKTFPSSKSVTSLLRIPGSNVRGRGGARAARRRRRRGNEARKADSGDRHVRPGAGMGLIADPLPAAFTRH